MSRRLDPYSPVNTACPIPAEGERVVLAHGAGAGASARLLEDRIFPHFENRWLAARHDGAVLDIDDTRLAFATDTFVVHPLEFPGGDIGSLAVNGTLNDLAMCGAHPVALSCSLVIEEGLPLTLLEKLVSSMGKVAKAQGVPIVTGDTKVVERGKGDGLFVNTAGIGRVPPDRDLRPRRVSPGDAILVSGSIGCHGAAILARREGLEFETEIESDCACLVPLVEALLDAVPQAHCLRDPTRGGLGAVLHEIAGPAGVEIEVEAETLPITAAVRSLTEVLGLDPLFLACEGRLVAFIPEPLAELALLALRGHALGRGAVRVGTVQEGPSRVVVRTALGARRLLMLPPGEPMPRIC